MTKRTLALPTFPCISFSYEKLCYRKDVIEFKKIKNSDPLLKSKTWDDSETFSDHQNMRSDYICIYCKGKYSENSMPPTCVQNNLEVIEPPAAVKALTGYEQTFIKRASAFQVVRRAEPVLSKGKKNLPHKHLQQKVFERTFHLPLPMEETLKKICDRSVPINPNQEFFILFRSIPNKGKIL